MSNIVPKHREPSRGVLAGIKSDHARAAGAQVDPANNRDPQGVGGAWTHNFLNQKPWHPANFRNQAKVFEAEQAAIKAAKEKEIAKQEFEAEQDYLKTLSYLSASERQKHEERASVSWLYQKPPGMESAVSQAKAAAAADASAAGAGGSTGGAAGAAGQQAEGQERQQKRPSQAAPTAHVAHMLEAMAALQQQDKWQVKHVSGMGARSPPRGGAAAGAANQQFVAGSDEEDDTGQNGASPAVAAPQGGAGRDSKRRKLAEAEAFLRAAGLEPSEVAGVAGKKASKKHKDKQKSKGSKKKKKKRSRRSESDSSSS